MRTRGALGTRPATGGAACRGCSERSSGRRGGCMEKAVRTLRVMVVDDNPVVSERLAGLLGEDERVEVCDRVESGLLAFARIAVDRPDAVLMDLEMPGIGGLAAIRRIKA